MSRACSVSVRRAYGKARVCRVWGVPRSTVYARQAAAASSAVPQRRGRPPAVSDGALLARVREVVREAEALGITGEGYRKLWVRLKGKGIIVCRERLRRLLREHGLQAPHRQGTARGPQVHDGTIIPEAPDRMWGTDATQA
ncbi:IS3 family transposase, partial [Thioalkalivibrio sp. ALJ24]|uniref:IS3 family transposase n=1 Tax=Thioalkalivibrio sp. ALJ24 TaxID=545276 RepID=UPI0005710ED7